MKQLVKLLSIISIFLVLTSSVIAADSIYEYDQLTLTQEISGTIDIIPTKSNYKVSYLETYLHLFPEDDYRQSVVREDIIPGAVTENNSLKFRWEDLNRQGASFRSSYDITTTNKPFPIKRKIAFPITEVPEDVEKYLQTTDFIDINQEIQNLATEIAQGHDDLFLLEHALGSWITENIEYNLSTITAEANQPSSLVIRQRYGVCDELTNLFISLNRALGIPARFVSGIAYSDSILFDEKWGNHGWAEVYFPDVGWVPYDVTYGQYGYLDATHIALSKEVDGGGASINYYAYGSGFDFEPTPLEFETVPIERVLNPLNPTTMSINMQEDTVGFDSYNLVSATIRNNLDSYIVEEVYLGQTENIEILDDDRFTVALLPGQEKELTWLVKVNNRLESGFYYTFPMVLFNGRYEEFRTEFEVRESGNRFDREYVEQYRVVQQETTADSGIVGCSAPREVHIDDSFVISCTSQEEAVLCIGEVCHFGKEASFSIIPTRTGISTKKISVTADDGIIERFVTYKVIDSPKLRIKTITLPEEINYGEVIALELTLEKVSASEPKNVVVTIDHNLWREIWQFPVLDQDKVFQLNIGSNSLQLNDNDISIAVTYEDDDGNTYTAQGSTQTTFTAENFGQKVKIIAGNAAFWIDKQFKLLL